MGQGKLYRTYDELLQARGVRSAQVLLTFFDMSARSHYLNARHTLQTLLRWRVVPVINENDTTTTDEISFGDNDFLAAQVAILLGADRLVLLTDTGGLHSADPRRDPDGAPDHRGERGRPSSRSYDIGLSTSPLGSGGMRSKVVAAEMATAAGIPVTIASGVDPESMARALAGEPTGTRFHPQEGRVSSFKLWLRYAKPTHGRLTVDEGAERALRERGTSLLPVGVVGVEGDFEAGDAVEVRCDGRAVGKGIVNYSAERAAADQGAEDGGRARGVAARDRGGRAPRLLRARLSLRSPYDREILPARRARARRAGGRAALPAGGHGDGRPPGHARAGRAGAGRHAAHRRLHAVQLPHLRHHRAGGAAARRRARRRRPAGSRRRRCGCPRGSASASRPCSPALAAPLVDLLGGDGTDGRPGRHLPADRIARACRSR